MKYNFDEVIDRTGTNSYKWDIAEGELPMWVADMDFRTASEIIKAITERAEHGVFGYSTIPDEWYSAYINWWKNRHGVEYKKSELNGNEKYYNLDDPLPTNSSPAGHISKGDIKLFGDDCIVLFYDSFTSGYSYTNIGYIEDTDGLEEALGSGSVTMTFEAK